MSTCKNFEKFCCIFLALSIIIACFSMNARKFGVVDAEKNNTYAQKLFGELSVNYINIIVDDNEWQNILSNASDKEYINCNMIINNDIFNNIAIRTKGNSSLSQVQSSDSDRYSFKIEFDHYDNTKSYYGLDKFTLNNIIQDNTYMKDYLAYTMMGEFGVASPLVNYAEVYVNGEAFGLYLAVEAIEEGFLQRNYGNNYGIAYKPETTGAMAGGGQAGGMERPNMGEMPDISQLPEDVQNMLANMTESELQELMGSIGQGNAQADVNNMQGQMTERPNDMGQMGEMPNAQADVNNMQGQMTERPNDMGQMGGMSSGSTGNLSALEYIDDNVDTYNYIFDNAVLNISNNDKVRLISSLKQLSEQENLEKILDIDAVLRYFVVHNYLLNFDSYTGGIMHNYYVYEKNGVLSMLPWDYNLSFVSFQTSYTTQQLVNFPIDTPISGNTIEQRPMLSWVFSNDEYTQMYHELFAEFISQMFDNDEVVNKIQEIKEIIAPFVENDPTKFCTYEQFEKGVETLTEIVTLRAESISGQLSGEIPSTAEGQSNDSKNLVSASHVDITDAGSERTSGNNDRGQMTTQNQGQMQGEQPQIEGDIAQTQGQLDVQSNKGQNKGDNFEQVEDGVLQNQAQGNKEQETQTQVQQTNDRNQMQQGMGQMTQNRQPNGVDNTPKTSEYIMIGVSAGVLALSLIFLKFYQKRKF